MTSQSGAILLCRRRSHRLTMGKHWLEWFRSWSRQGNLAHPNSPDGGSGPGFSRPPGPQLDSHLWAASGVPHPDSPSGQHFSWHAGLPSGAGLKMSIRGQIRQISTKQDIDEFRRDPFSLRSFGLLVKAISLWLHEDTTPAEERSKVILRNISLATGYAVGLGQNTTKALAGDDVSADKIRSEMPGNLLVGAGWSLKAIQLFRETAMASRGFRAWLAEADLNRLARGAAATQAPEIAAGFLAQHLPALRRLFGGKPLTSAEINDLGRVWAAAANPGEAATLTLQNSRRLFDNHLDRFWRSIRGDSAARRLFTDAGFTFEGAARSAPTRTLSDGTVMQITLDHIVERQSAPLRALDPSNLRISTRLENTVLLRQITQQDPFQR